ncbi:hypothetical protein [Mesorhizobium sp. M0239]|uniref:hypothetical protein n=1 Tax=Mesorhizobium sp. M0239 TaxID=2956924 RepID=UPI00333D60DE
MVTLLVAIITTGLLFWSAIKTDSVAVSRQKSLVALMIRSHRPVSDRNLSAVGLLQQGSAR